MTRPTASASIAERMTGCLHRQIEAFEAAQRDLESMDPATESASPEVLAAQALHARRVHQLEEELRLLLPEWHAADPPPTTGEREAISGLATRAQALADDLQRKYQAGQDRARALSSDLRQAIDTLRASRVSLRYHPNPDDPPRQMDAKA